MATISKRPPRFHTGDAVAFLYGPQRVSGTIVEDRGQLGAHGRRLYLVRVDLGQDDSPAFEIPEEDLEDFTDRTLEGQPGVRREYGVSYIREAETNRWVAMARVGDTYHGLKVTGAVAYTTSRWEGETQSDERHAVVSVFLEPDSNMDAESMSRLALQYADQMFKRRHPGAQIDHDVEGDG